MTHVPAKPTTAMPRGTLSVVVPVFHAGAALERTCTEILQTAGSFQLASSYEVGLAELVLVVDNPDLSAADSEALESLAERDPRIRTVWLSTNFGQHPATIAGIVSTNGDWVVTMDEDGQHDPGSIRDMLMVAADTGRPLVYADPTNARPHGALRNASSWLAGRVAVSLNPGSARFHSYRLMEGALARAACAYAGDNVFLDVALGWTCGGGAGCPVAMREESTPSAYNFRRLLSHFWRLVLSSGTRPLRGIALAGFIVATLGVFVGAYVVVQRLTGGIVAQGWASVFVLLLLLFGGLYVSLSVLAEYLGMIVRNTIGKPVYVRVDPPAARALAQLRKAVSGHHVDQRA